MWCNVFFYKQSTVSLNDIIPSKFVFHFSFLYLYYFRRFSPVKLCILYQMKNSHSIKYNSV